ncbi:MAG: hypothetical protein LBK66_01440, partial [Spirochaetaceae bacterium]|nr:hypothetical protein [Spirochaetaceae bacterium]
MIIFSSISCKKNDIGIINEYEIEYLNNFRNELNIESINGYEEIYRMYEMKALKKPNILTVYKENKIWYFTYGWLEIKGEAKLFENNELIYIFHNDKIILDDDDLQKFLRIIDGIE